MARVVIVLKGFRDTLHKPGDGKRLGGNEFDFHQVSVNPFQQPLLVFTQLNKLDVIPHIGGKGVVHVLVGVNQRLFQAALQNLEISFQIDLVAVDQNGGHLQNDVLHAFVDLFLVLPDDMADSGHIKIDEHGDSHADAQQEEFIDNQGVMKILGGPKMGNQNGAHGNAGFQFEKITHKGKNKQKETERKKVVPQCGEQKVRRRHGDKKSADAFSGDGQRFLFGILYAEQSDNAGGCGAPKPEPIRQKYRKAAADGDFNDFQPINFFHVFTACSCFILFQRQENNRGSTKEAFIRAHSANIGRASCLRRLADGRRWQTR